MKLFINAGKTEKFLFDEKGESDLLGLYGDFKEDKGIDARMGRSKQYEAPDKAEHLAKADLSTLGNNDTLVVYAHGSDTMIGTYRGDLNGSEFADLLIGRGLTRQISLYIDLKSCLCGNGFSLLLGKTLYDTYGIWNEITANITVHTVDAKGKDITFTRKADKEIRGLSRAKDIATVKGWYNDQTHEPGLIPHRMSKSVDLISGDDYSVGEIKRLISDMIRDKSNHKKNVMKVTTELV